MNSFLFHLPVSTEYGAYPLPIFIIYCHMICKKLSRNFFEMARVFSMFDISSELPHNVTSNKTMQSQIPTWKRGVNVKVPPLAKKLLKIDSFWERGNQQF